MSRQVIGLCGYARAGKDTAAEALILLGWERVAFADPLKAIARELGWDGQKNKAGREFLQTLGSSVRAHLHVDAWVDATVRHIQAINGDVIVTDVRYPNEAQALRSLGALIIRIDRPGVSAANDHESERVDLIHPHGIIINDGERDALWSKMVAAVSMIRCDACGLPIPAASDACPKCGSIVHF